MVEIKRNPSFTDRTVFDAHENGAFLGRVGGKLLDDVFEFDELDCDGVMLDGLVRAILNLMSMKGVSKARFNFSEITLYEKLVKLGFVKNDDNMIHNIDNFFTEHKNCVKK